MLESWCDPQTDGPEAVQPTALTPDSGLVPSANMQQQGLS